VVDVMPTVARLLALGAPDAAGDGHDLSTLWTASAAAPERVVLAELSRGHDQRMVRAGDLKLIEDRARGSVALFDLASDPGETKDRSGSQPEARSRLVARLHAALDGEPARESEIKPLADSEVRALKSMGYVQ
jgi:arylsulfatase A-like enzyme